MKLKAAKEVLQIAVDEGVITPRKAQQMSDVEVCAWYDRVLSLVPDGEERPF